MLEIKYNKAVCKETETRIILFIDTIILEKSDRISRSLLLNEEMELSIKFINKTTCEMKIFLGEEKQFNDIKNITVNINNSLNFLKISIFHFKPIGKIKSEYNTIEGLFEIEKDDYCS